MNFDVNPLLREAGFTGGFGDINAWAKQNPQKMAEIQAEFVKRNAVDEGQYSGVASEVKLGSQALLGASWGMGAAALMGGAAAAGEGAAAAGAGEGAAAGGATAGAEAGGAAGAFMPAAVAETPAALSSMGLTETVPGVFEAAAVGGPGATAFAAPGAGSPEGAPLPSFLSAASPTLGLDAATAEALGISSALSGMETSTGMVAGGAPFFGSEGMGSMGEFAGETSGQWGGATGMGVEGGGILDGTAAMLKRLGLSPATAGLLGISGLQALSKPKVPDAAKTLQAQAGPAAASANAVIQSGGTGGPQWATQKSSIDATVDQQLNEQIQAMLQQAVNSGQGADSQVTQQQINKLKNQLETVRQQLYAQAQAQNVDAALRQLGISDQALANVAQAQFASSNQARSAAAQTASLALMLSVLGKG